MTNKTSTAKMIDFLTPIMGNEDTRYDFAMPTLLREIPSYTTSDSGGKGSEVTDAKLQSGIGRTSN